MSAVHGIAWGLVEITPSNFKTFRRAVRDELRNHRMTLRPATGQHQYVLIRRRHGYGKGYKMKQRIGYGDLKRCCEIASKLITPSNPER
jgi:hypothetical protein